jgi:hypothetical protein
MSELLIALKPEFALQPLVFYGLLAVGLVLCLYLFLSVKAEGRGLLQRCLETGRQVKALEAGLNEARERAVALAADLRVVERQTGMLVEPAPARSGLNLSKRTQILRMHRSGQDSAGIASSLSLPRSEVDLLIKVHRMVVEQS